MGIREARPASKTADEDPHDDSRILTCLRRRLELLSPATLPLCETFGLIELKKESPASAEGVGAARPRRLCEVSCFFRNVSPLPPSGSAFCRPPSPTNRNWKLVTRK